MMTDPGCSCVRCTGNPGGEGVELYAAAQAGDVELLRGLRARGVDFSQLGFSADGASGFPLGVAAGEGHLAAVQTILEDETPLEILDRALAMATGGGHVSCMEALLAAGADPCTPKRGAAIVEAVFAAARGGGLAPLLTLMVAAAARGAEGGRGELWAKQHADAVGVAGLIGEGALDALALLLLVGRVGGVPVEPSRALARMVSGGNFPHRDDPEAGESTVRLLRRYGARLPEAAEIAAAAGAKPANLAWLRGMWACTDPPESNAPPPSGAWTAADESGLVARIARVAAAWHAAGAPAPRGGGGAAEPAER